MSIPKEDVKIGKITDLIEKNDNKTLYDCVYNLYTLIEISRGIEDIKEGHGVTLEEFNKEREDLYESYSRRFG